MINFSQQLTVEVLDFTSNDEMLTQQIPKLGREKRRSNLQIWESQDFIAIHSYWLTWDHLLRSFEYGNVHLYTLNISDLVFTWLVNTRRKCRASGRTQLSELNELKWTPKAKTIAPQPTWLCHLFHMSDRSSFPATGPLLLGGILRKNMNLIWTCIGISLYSFPQESFSAFSSFTSSSSFSSLASASDRRVQNCTWISNSRVLNSAGCYVYRPSANMSKKFDLCSYLNAIPPFPRPLGNSSAAVVMVSWPAASPWRSSSLPIRISHIHAQLWNGPVCHNICSERECAWMMPVNWLLVKVLDPNLW